MQPQIILTDEQDYLIGELKRYYLGNRSSNHPWYSYSGPPGTGKTTVIRELIKVLGLSDDEYITTAYTGKAVLNLLQHDLPAKTYHSLVYRTLIEIEKPDTDAIDQRVKRHMRFVLRDTLDKPYRLIIVDEATMINDKMQTELQSFGIPVIYVGDMNQLPPVFGTSSVMMQPDFVLTQIMRQKEDDPIVIFCQNLLKGIPLELGTYGDSDIVAFQSIDSTVLTDFDQIICGKNKTRSDINNEIRKNILHRRGVDPHIGDKMICRQNNWDEMVDGIYLTNGLVGYIKDVQRSTAYKGFYNVAFQPEFMHREFEGIALDLRYLRASDEERKSYGLTRYNKFEYGYAITTHVSQGSEYDSVLFVDERFWDREFTRSIRYTAISRAKKKVRVVLDEDRAIQQYYGTANRTRYQAQKGRWD